VLFNDDVIHDSLRLRLSEAAELPWQSIGPDPLSPRGRSLRPDVRSNSRAIRTGQQGGGAARRPGRN
jgi:hypothetical protein